MKRWKFVCAAILTAALVCGAFFLGRFTAGVPAAQSGVSFHAEILERDGARFHVNGLDCNDINSRGEFCFAVRDDTPLIWRGTQLTLDDLDAGDRIMVTHSGEVMDIYPAQLAEVYRIDLLEDEK